MLENNPIQMPVSKPAPKSGSKYAVIAKTAACVLFFLAAATFFAGACAELAANYGMILVPTAAILPWLIRILVSAFLTMLGFGVVAAMVRPLWVAMLVMAAAGALFALLLGGGVVAWAGAAAGAALLCGLLLGIAKGLENQIHFSVRPVSDKELKLSSILAVLVAVAVGMGYAADAGRGQYVIPPRIMVAIAAQLNGSIASLAQTQMVPAALRGAVQEAAKGQVAAMIAGFETMARPFAAYAPYVLGLVAYFTAQLAFYLPGLLASLLIGPVLWLLKMTGFVRESSGMEMVSRWGLGRAGE
ncbi:MAG: hypothetical protein RLZZ324_707 [Candidatus Parcubacteria bacterium]|jgi:hypothetical protein